MKTDTKDLSKKEKEQMEKSEQQYLSKRKKLKEMDEELNNKKHNVQIERIRLKNEQLQLQKEYKKGLDRRINL